MASNSMAMQRPVDAESSRLHRRLGRLLGALELLADPAYSRGKDAPWFREQAKRILEKDAEIEARYSSPTDRRTAPADAPAK